MEQDFIFQNLVIEPYEVEKIVDVRITQHINEHGTLYVKALIADNNSTKYVNECRNGKSIILSYNDSNGKKRIIFKGMNQSVEEYVEQGSCYIEINAISYTYMLDIDKKSRTFQDREMLYKTLIDQVTVTHDSADFVDNTTDGKAIEELIVQYEETDWEFLKRLASHFETGIISSLFYDHIMFDMGIPSGRQHNIDVYNYSVKKDLKKYLYYSQNSKTEFLEDDFVYYTLDTQVPMSIGDSVSIKGKSLIVNSVDANINKGMLMYHVVLSTKRGMSILHKDNLNIVGCSLNAKITDIQNDRVKVSIEIDEMMGHDPGAARFFPYSTIYSSQDGSGWYCMPEKGDSVRIYFPDGTEDHSYAISSVHDEVTGGADGGDSEGESGGSCSSGDAGAADSYSGKRDDPSVKSLKNSNGKEIRLTPEGIFILSDGTSIILTDEGGVSIVSDKDIEFKSDQSINICAEQDINIMGSTGVDLNCNDTSFIKMKDNVEVIGQEVKAN